MKEENVSYRIENAPWPGEHDEPWNAEGMLRWLSAEGTARAAVGPDLAGYSLDVPGGVEAFLRHSLNIAWTQHYFDLHLALSALRDLDPTKADEVAHQIVLAAVAGDSYGEWLWQWAKGHGLDADRIVAEAHEDLKAEGFAE